jgi:hypothetical protein
MTSREAPLPTVTLALVIGMVASCAPASAPADAGGTPPGTGGEACSLGSMGLIEQRVFQGPKCLVCHIQPTLYPTTLDLRNPGLADRIVDRPAEANPDRGKCAGKILVPRDDPLGGLLVDKVAHDHPSCGDRMPQGLPALTPDEIACVKAWSVMAAQR